MYYRLPKEARKELVFDYSNNPMTLNVCYAEVKNNTKTGSRILTFLGYKDDEATADKNEETLKEHDKHCDFCKGFHATEEDRKAEEKLLDDFIMQERMKFRAGSGDDMFYEEQIINYINKPIVNKQIVKYVNEQRAFWLDFIRFIQKVRKA